MSLSSQIESLLFIAAKPLSAHQLAEFCAVKKEESIEAADALVETYKEKAAGLQVVKNGDKYQMVSSPQNAAVVQAFVKDETTGDLSRPSLEALTIIAYRGPISKIDLDRIRGVNCALILRNLLLRGLIEAKPGKSGEARYVVTFDFIRFLGINDIRDLPEYERLHQDDTIDRVLKDPEEGAEGAKGLEKSQEEEEDSSESPLEGSGRIRPRGEGEQYEAEEPAGSEEGEDEMEDEDDEDEYDDEDEDEDEDQEGSRGLETAQAEIQMDDSDGAEELQEGDTVVVIETTGEDENGNEEEDKEEEENEEDEIDDDEDEKGREIGN